MFCAAQPYMTDAAQNMGSMPPLGDGGGNSEVAGEACLCSIPLPLPKHTWQDMGSMPPCLCIVSLPPPTKQNMEEHAPFGFPCRDSNPGRAGESRE